MNNSASELPASPYPGLRPFRRDEADIFFGRGSQIAEMLTRLECHRFLAVVGASGCGKSSLVSAGLLPALEQGFLETSGDKWNIICLRPGDAPLRNLSRELLRTLRPDPSAGEPDPHRTALVQAGLRSGPKGLLHALEEADVSPDTNVLVLVDQFEELFRFRHCQQAGIKGPAPGSSDGTSAPVGSLTDQRDEAAAFVSLLLATAAQRDRPIYVVITMRSDFLGDCDTFHGLPEAINDSQFLTPRMNRDQTRDAIMEPLRVRGGEIEEALVNHILNEMGDDPDQLPLMQHALMRTWYRAHERGQPISMRLADYEGVGRLKEALSRHADDVLAEISNPSRLGKSPAEENKRVAEMLFRCLCDRNVEKRLTRRLATVAGIAAVAGTSIESVMQVADAFRQPGRSFLSPPPSVDLTADSTLDISHESLIRQWRQLQVWIEREERSAAIYRRLSQSACLWAAGEASPYRFRELKKALKWRATERPTAAWANRYDANFDQSMKFLDASFRVQIIYMVVAGVLILAIGFGFGEWAKANRVALALSHEVARVGYEQRDIADSAAEEGRLDKSLAFYLRAYQSAQLTKEDVLKDSVRHLLGAVGQRAGRVHLHEAPVVATAFSPDGRTLVTGSRDSTAQLWDARSGQALGSTMKHKGPVWAVAFSPNGDWVLTGSGDRENPTAHGEAQLWDARTGQARSGPLKHDAAVVAAVFSPDGQTVLTGSLDATARLWDTATGRLRTSLKHSAPVVAVAFSPDNKTALTGSGDPEKINGEARLWDVKSGEQKGKAMRHENVVWAVAYSSDGNFVLTGSEDGTARFWNAVTGEQEGKTMEHVGPVLTVAFSPLSKSKTAVTGSFGNEARLWDVPTGEPLKALQDSIPVPPLKHGGPVLALAFSEDGQTVVSGSYDGTAQVWDIRSGVARVKPLKHDGPVLAVSLSRDGRSVLTGSFDETARLWTFSDLVMEHTREVRVVALSLDGKTIVTGCNDNTARLWDSDGKPRGIVLQHRRDVIGAAVMAAKFSPKDSNTVFTCSSDGTAQLWDVHTGKALCDPLKHDDPVSALAVSPDGRWLLTGSGNRSSRNGKAQLWDARSGKACVRTWKHEGDVSAVAFSPDSKTAVTGSMDGTVGVWDVESGKPKYPALEHRDAIYALAVSPDGETIGTASGNIRGTLSSDPQERGEARLWDLHTGKPHGAPLPHRDTVWAIAFSPDGQTLFTGSLDTTARLWDVGTGKAHGPPLQHSDAVLAVAFSPDGSRILTGSGDLDKHRGVAQLWDARTGQPLRVHREHRDAVWSVAFDPDGTRVLTASSDKTARLWDVPSAALDEPNQLQLSVEVRTGLHFDEHHNLKRLTAREWRARRDRLVEFCDVVAPVAAAKPK